MIVMSGYDQQKINVYKGYIGERLAAKYLKKQSYQVQSFMVLVDFIVNHTKSPLHDWMGDKIDDFIKMNKAFNKIYSGSQHGRRALDFIAKKDGKFYAVEVKTNSSKLSENQEKELELSKKFGFTPIIVKTKVTLVAKLEDVKLLML